jgi:tripartite-type tricarboxylate transporter receptor subunit TctC
MPVLALTRRAFGAALLGCFSACSALSPSGRRPLRVLVGGSSGSSYERVARLLTPPLHEQLGDRRLMVTLRPHAGGRLMAKELAEGPRDGTLIGYVPSGLIYAELLNEPGIAFELRRFAWLASATAERRVLLVSNRTGIRSLDDLRSAGRLLNVSANAVGSPTWVSPLLLNAMLGTRLRPIPGYANGPREAAVLNGEVDGVLATISSSGGLLGSGAVTPIVRLSPGRAPVQLGDVPVLRDLIGPGRWRLLVELIEAHDDFGRSVAAPPQTPDHIVTPLRRAFDAALGDPEVIASAARSGMLIQAASGEDVGRRLDTLLSDAALPGVLEEAVNCGLGRTTGAAAC